MATRRIHLAVLLLGAAAGCGAAAHDNAGDGGGGAEAGRADVQGCGDGGGFTVGVNALSAAIPTVGIVEWGMAGTAPTSAKIVFRAKTSSPTDLNQGGEAPVDLAKANFRTLLLGLKQGTDYTFHIEAVRDGKTCISADYALPTTGTLAARPATVAVTQPSKRAPGFIVAGSGTSVTTAAYILDADGDVVWYFDAPLNPTRALMDYEGENMWMVSLNLDNWGGEMRYVSMDGTNLQQNVPGLDHAHHDFTVLPGGRIAALAWADSGIDPESDLLIRAPDGTVTNAFRIGSNLYLSDTFHANAIHYVVADDSFTIADRNPNVFVKVSASGALAWQLGGSCDSAPAGNLCVARDWQVTHGHHLVDDNTFLAFNNGNSGPAHIFEFQLAVAAAAFTATVVEDYSGSGASTTMGDVQRLPGGNTLITYSSDGRIVEVDPDWNVVQTFATRVGYSSWRPTLYGPPPRP